MYIDKILVENVGPIEKFLFVPKFNDNGNPLPTVIIGDNGKGKTVLSSYIADSILELAKHNGAYNNVVEKQGAYYKIITSSNIKKGKDYSTVVISNVDSKKFSYVEKFGKVPIEDVRNDIMSITNYEKIELELKKDKSVKKIIGEIDRDEIDELFDNNVLCFFPSYRSEKPAWMNKNAVKYNEIYKESQRFNGILNKEIVVEHAEERNSNWVHSVIIDSLLNVNLVNNSYHIEGNIENSQYLKKAKENLEKILKLILKADRVELSMNYRNQNNNFKITYYELVSKNKNDTVYVQKEINSLKDLSLGQAVLFNMFASIIRHADINNIHNSVKLSNIKGVVVIDEIDMHLDSEMQNEVLPKLIKLFPKIQFFITSHSPLFLLGMDKEFANEYTLIEMPDGREISTERFSEFEKSYKYLNDTKKHEDEINKMLSDKIQEIKNNTHVKPLIITEGKTDWIHLKNAYERLKQDGEYKDLDIDFLEYYETMGEDELCKMKDSFARIPQTYKMIFIADRDTDKKDIENFEKDGKYVNWKNNVFTFRIPIPPHRVDTPKICIEHYYSDDEIKREFEVKGIKRRLFMASEFNMDTGDFLGEEMYRMRKLKVKNPIEIIEGDQKNRVTKFKDPQEINYALSKNEFAQKITECDDVSYKNFKLIFDVIKEIIEE